MSSDAMSVSPCRETGVEQPLVPPPLPRKRPAPHVPIRTNRCHPTKRTSERLAIERGDVVLGRRQVLKELTQRRSAHHAIPVPDQDRVVFVEEVQRLRFAAPTTTTIISVSTSNNGNHRAKAVLETERSQNIPEANVHAARYRISNKTDPTARKTQTDAQPAKESSVRCRRRQCATSMRARTLTKTSPPLVAKSSTDYRSSTHTRTDNRTDHTREHTTHPNPMDRGPAVGARGLRVP